MYSGRMIEDLIASVQTAEAHAAPGPAASEHAVQGERYTPRTYSFTQNSIIEELLGVA